MSEWVVVVLLACVTVDGESIFQEVGFATNQKQELIIISPPWLDVKLKRKEKLENFTLLIDENRTPYSIHSVFLEGKFIFFISELREKKMKKGQRLHHIPPGYQAVNSYIISSIEPLTEQIPNVIP